LNSRQEGIFMLVLTRRVGEEIVIDGRITIRVTAVRGGHAQIGIDAPPAVRIVRKELEHRPSKEPPPKPTPTAD
jgi:carbon storage regulator